METEGGGGGGVDETRLPCEDDNAGNGQPNWVIWKHPCFCVELWNDKKRHDFWNALKMIRVLYMVYQCFFSVEGNKNRSPQESAEKH